MLPTLLPHRSNGNTECIEHDDLKMQDLHVKSHEYDQLPDTAKWQDRLTLSLHSYKVKIQGLICSLQY